MANRSDFIGEKLKVNRIMEQAYFPEYILKCREFLMKKLVKKHVTTDITIEQLEVIENSARRMAKYLYAAVTESEKELPDFSINFDEIMEHKNQQLCALKEYMQAILEILGEVTLPASLMNCTVTANVYVRCGEKNCNNIRRLKMPSLASQLKNCVRELDKSIKPKITMKKQKKEKKPLRTGIISELTYAWMDITGRAPEKLKRVGDKAYGDFYEFIKSGLRLFKRGIHAEEAVKEAYPIFLKRLAGEASIFVINKANKEFNKIKNDLTQMQFCEQVFVRVKESNFFDQSDENRICKLIQDAWDEHQKYMGELVPKNN
jgi:hypothetical protein